MSTSRSPWLTIRLRRLPLSLRLDRRVPALLLILLLLNAAVLVLSIGYGMYAIAPLDVLKALLGFATGNQDHGFIIWTLRLPRVLVALLVGMALALSGSITQTLLRNPLASPDILGISAGAAFAAVSLIVLLPAASVASIPFAAFAGGSLSAGLIYVLARGGASPARQVLVGIGVSAICAALTTTLITLGEINAVTQALIWMAGSVYGRSWEHLLPLLGWLALCAPLALLSAEQLNVLSLGPQVARGLGSRVERQQGLLLLIAVALAAAAVATAGTIGFVGLMAPHIARRLVGPTHQGLLPTAALTGGLLLVLADLLGRALFAPIEIPCGVIIAVVGAPYLLYLLFRERRV